MARQIVPTDKPARLIFPAGTHVKVTNTGEQIVWISDVESGLYQIDPASGTPLTGMPLSPGSTETWWGPDGLWVLTPLPGGEVEYSFSGAASMQEPVQRDLPFPSRAIEPGFPLVRMPQTEATSVLLPGLRGKFILRMIILALALMPLARAQTPNPGSAPRVLFPGLNVINPSFQLSTANSPLYVNVTYPPNATSAGLIVNGASSGTQGSSSNFTVGPNPVSIASQSGAGAVWTLCSGTLLACINTRDSVQSGASMAAAGNSNLIAATGFGFSIPANANVTGVVATAYVSGDNANVVDSSVLLLKANVTAGTQHANGTLWPVAITAKSWGSSVDLWGTTWTPGDINNSGFGVQLSAHNNNGSSVKTAGVDYITVTVYYSVTTPNTAGTLISYSALQRNPLNTQPLACVVDQFLSMSRCPISTTGSAQIQLTAAAGSPQQIAMYVFVFTGADMLRPGFSLYTAIQLGINAITLPISGTTAVSNLVDTRGAKELFLLGTCTQAVTINFFYADGNGNSAGGGSTTGASASFTFHMGSESGPTTNETIANTWFQFPQRGVLFSFTNSTAIAGTCTAGLYLAY